MVYLIQASLDLEIVPPLAAKLSWSHFIELLLLKNQEHIIRFLHPMSEKLIFIYEKNIELNQKRLIESVKKIILDSRKSAAININHELIAAYWNVGKVTIANEKANSVDTTSSRQIILELSKRLTIEIGRGFSRSNLFNMRKFYLGYPDVQTLSGQLTWSHICELLIIEDVQKKEFYEKEAINSPWSVRELKRQIDSSLFEIVFTIALYYSYIENPRRCLGFLSSRL